MFKRVLQDLRRDVSNLFEKRNGEFQAALQAEEISPSVWRAVLFILLRKESFDKAEEIKFLKVNKHLRSPSRHPSVQGRWL
jgi:hypothetical protein